MQDNKVPGKVLATPLPAGQMPKESRRAFPQIIGKVRFRDGGNRRTRTNAARRGNRPSRGERARLIPRKDSALTEIQHDLWLQAHLATSISMEGFRDTRMPREGDTTTIDHALNTDQRPRRRRSL